MQPTNKPVYRTARDTEPENGIRLTRGREREMLNYEL